MGWLSRLKAWATRDTVERVDDTFVPQEWVKHFGSLAPEERRAVATSICRKVLDTVAIDGDDVERAITAIASGLVGSDVLRPIRSLVERFEGEYDSVVGDDESKLSCSDPEIATAFIRARAAMTLQCALEGDLGEMAYEAWFVLDDLGEVRRLTGMPPLIRRPT
jgi:hypothetical protein